MSVEPTIGEIMLFAGAFEPYPWLFCDGRILPIIQYGALYSVIGPSYGGNGVTTFALPDLRGRFPIGQGQGQQGSFHPMGQRRGVEAVSLHVGHLPSHSHGMTAMGSGQALARSPSEKLFARGHSDRFAPADAGPLVDMGGALTPVGGWAPHENRQPLLALHYVIAASGSYPSRG